MNILSLGTPALDLGSVAGGDAGADGKAPFELRAGFFSRGELAVVSYEGREALSTPYEYEVQFSSSAPEALLQMGIFGFPACLSIDVPGHAPRVIQGIAAGFGCVGAADVERASNARRYSMKIVPRLWLLQQSRRYRVFQDRSAIDVAVAVLDEAGIPYKLRLVADDYPPIPFVYQRGETDLEFLHRVLATAGIFYFFQHASGLLEELLPGAGELAGLAGGVGAMADAAGGLSIGASAGSFAGSVAGGLAGGAIAAVGAVAGVAGTVVKEIGAVTTLVLCDDGGRTEALRDGAEMTDAAMDLGGAALGALGLAGAVAGVAAAANSLTLGLTGTLTDGPGDAIPYDPNAEAATALERIFSFRVHKEVRPRALLARDWDVAVNRPVSSAETSKLANLDVNLGLGMTLGPQGFGLSAGLNADLNVDAIPIAAREVTVTEYQRDASLLSARTDILAGRALAQLRSDWVLGHGESDSRRLAAGYRFQIAGHPIDPVNAEYVVTSVVTRGFAPDQTPGDETPLFRNTFVCVPASTNPRPPKPAPQVYGPETATVVGPTWGDVFTDAVGRIQVQFHWASGDEGTCWVQWVERWGGDGYGTLSIPRVGSEVVVDFMQHAGGRPIATGQVYSADNAPPFEPGLKVGVRTTTGEISIDDAPGREEVLVRSAANLRIEGATTTQTFTTLATTVEDERSEETLGNAKHAFGKDVATTVAGSATTEVTRDRVSTVNGSASETIGGDLTTTVLGRCDTRIHAELRATYEGDATARHQGHYVLVVGAEEPKSACVHVEGPVTGYAKGPLELTSLEGFTLTCGKSRITIAKDSITLSSPNVIVASGTMDLKASDSATLAAKSMKVTGSDSVAISGKKATVSGQSAQVALDSAAKITGASVKLGSGSGSGEASQTQDAPAKKVSTIRLVDADGKPFGNERVVLRKGGEGGEERVVVLDADGQATVEGDGPFDVFFVDEASARPQ